MKNVIKIKFCQNLSKFQERIEESQRKRPCGFYLIILDPRRQEK